MERWSSLEEQLMLRALRVASAGESLTRANPMVGALIARGEHVLCEDYHHAYGGPHAERNVIKRARELGLDLAETTLYVTLEPCAHQGKTPPCVEAILETPIPRIIVGTPDPNPATAGKGIEMLRARGREVKVGLLAEQCQQLNHDFFTFHTLHRPYVLLKWAETLDGFIDSDRLPQEPAPWISSRIARVLVHQWRARYMAIFTGANTIARDNPRLDVRMWKGQNPIRVTIARELALPLNRHFFNGKVPTIVITEEQNRNSKRWDLFEAIPQLELVTVPAGQTPEQCALNTLAMRNITSIMVEGGSKTISRFYSQNLWDSAHIFVGNRTFGRGINAPDFPRHPSSRRMVGSSLLITVENPKPASL